MASTPINLIVILACVLAQPSVRAGELRALVLDGEGKPLSDAVIVAFPADARTEQAKPGTEVEDQIDKEFVPYVQVIRVGSTVRFPNNDNIRHHVYSFSAAKKFVLPLYSGTPATPVLFDKVGVVRLGCNIHDWMIGYLYVTDAPYFGKTAVPGRVDMLLQRYRIRTLIRTRPISCALREVCGDAVDNDCDGLLDAVDASECP